jgi:hypothetical protein
LGYIYPNYIPLNVIEEVVDKEVVGQVMVAIHVDGVLFGDDGGGKVAAVQ